MAACLALGCQWIVGVEDRSAGLDQAGTTAGQSNDDSGSTNGGATGNANATGGAGGIGGSENGASGGGGTADGSDGGRTQGSTGAASTGASDIGADASRDGAIAPADAGSDASLDARRDATAGGSTGGSTGSGSSSGGSASSGSTSGTGSTGSTGAGSTGSGPSSTGSSTASTGSDGGACPNVFTQSSLSWAVKEGDAAGAVLNIPIALGATAPGDWRVVLDGAPAWLSPPSSPASATALEIDAPTGVPYDAYPGPASFTVRLELKADSTCQSRLTVTPAITNVLHAPSEYTAYPSGISFAAWHAPSQSFYLLNAAAGTFYVLDTTKTPPAVGPARPLAASGTVAPQAFAVSDTELYAIVNGAVLRMGLDGSAAGAAVPIANPPPAGVLTMAWASGWILVGDDAGPARALSDAKNAFEASSFLSWSDASGVVSDGGSFAFSTPDGNKHDMWRVTPPDFSRGPSCLANPSADDPPAVSGELIAWVEEISLEFRLDFGTLDTACTGQDYISLGTPAFSYPVVGMANGRALVLTNVTGSTTQKLDLALFDVPSETEIGMRLMGKNSDPLISNIVMGGLQYALIVTAGGSTAGRPLLVQL